MEARNLVALRPRRPWLHPFGPAIYRKLSPPLGHLRTLENGDFLLPFLQALSQEEHGDGILTRRHQAQASSALRQPAHRLSSFCLLQLQSAVVRGRRCAGHPPGLAVLPCAALLQRGAVPAGGAGEDRRQVGAPAAGAGERVPPDRDGETGRLAHLRAHGYPPAVRRRAGPRRPDPEPAVAHVHQGGAVHLRRRRGHYRHVLGAAALLWRPAGGVLLPAGPPGGADGAVRGGDAGTALRDAGERRVRRGAGQARRGRRPRLPLLRRLLRLGARAAARRGARRAVAHRGVQPRRAGAR